MQKYLAKHNTNMIKIERILALVSIIIINAIVLFTILKSKSLMKVRTTQIFAVLSLTYLMYGIVDLTWEISDKNTIRYFIYLFLHCGQSVIIVMTVDRLMAIKCPFAYQRTTIRTTISMLCGAFLFALTVFTMQICFTTLPIQSTVCTCLVFFNVLFLSTVNALMFSEARKHIVKIKTQQMSITENSSHISNANVNIGQIIYERQNPVESVHQVDYLQPATQNEIRRASQQDVRRSFLRKEIRAAYMCIRLVASYAILWLPWSIHRSIKLITGNPYKDFLRAANFLAVCNALVDPILYIIFNKLLRNTIWSTLRTFKTVKKTNSKVAPAIVPPFGQNVSPYRS